MKYIEIIKVLLILGWEFNSIPTNVKEKKTKLILHNIFNKFFFQYSHVWNDETHFLKLRNL